MSDDKIKVGTSALPISRVHRIIKADIDVRLCSKESIFLIGKATEYMIGKLTAQAHEKAMINKRPKMIKYSDLAAVTVRPEWFYLSEVIPLTITLASAQQKSSATDGSLLDVSDENHPSHPSTTGNTSVVPVKKGRKKAPAAAASTTAEGATKAGSGVAQWAGAAKPPAGGDATLMEVDG